MQNNSNDKTDRSNTVQDLKESNSQILATKGKRGEHLFSMMPGIKKAFDLVSVEPVKLSTEN